MGYIRDLDPEVRERDAVLHEKYQESPECMEDALNWWGDMTDDDILHAFVKSPAYHDYFEEWANE